MNIKEAAEVVKAEMRYPDGPAQFGPLVDAIIIQVIAKLITTYGPILIDKIINHKPLNLCDKFAVKTLIRRACPTKEDYKKHGVVIYDAVLKSCPKFTPDQIKSLVASVNSGQAG